MGPLARACERLPVLTAGTLDKRINIRGALLPCYWTLLIEAAPRTEGHKRVLKPETPCPGWCLRNSLMRMAVPGEREEEISMSRDPPPPPGEWFWSCARGCWTLLSILSVGQLSTKNEELPGLWRAVPRWMNNILSGRPPLWLKNIQTRQHGALNCMLFS